MENIMDEFGRYLLVIVGVIITICLGWLAENICSRKGGKK